jgi:nuclear pore complex protein Nup85
MVAKILFTDPAVTVFNLKKHAVSCIEIFNGFSNLTPLDEIVLAVMAFDVHKIVEKTSSCLPSWWFVSHLTDLLFHCNMLTIQEPNYGEKLREFLLLEYSASLMSHSSLWRIAADYLMVCPINGKNHLEAYIEKLPLENETKALKVINLCNQHGFTEQVTNICKVMGMKALRRKRFGVALSWCIRSKDQGFASFLTDQFLTHYDETGRFVHPDLIENLGSAMLMNNKLTFLAQYYEFHKLYGDRKLKEAGSLLTSLLNSGLAPKRFWSILLLDAIPLLMNDEIIFDSSQTYELIHFLKELELCVDSTDSIRDWKPKPTTKAEEENEQNKLQLLQLGLSRNLSRSLLAEAATEAVR